MAVCPLSIISGKQAQCKHDCAYCPPSSLDSIAQNTNYFDYLQCLNFPNDMFGNGLAESGLHEVASSLEGVACAIIDLKDMSES